MSGTLILLELAGSVALLLWATRMVQTGMQRAYGDVLKDVMRRALGSAPSAAAAGGLLAMALQSATAVAIIIAGFVGAGLVPVARGIGALLGADLGSALVALILQLDLSLLMPVFLLSGLFLFLKANSRRWQQLGRILVGVGLILLALRLISATAAPLRDGAILPLVLAYLVEDWLTAFLLAGLFALLVHSSIASVLVLAAMAQEGLVPAPLILPLVLGINAGAALIPLYLTRGQKYPARLVPFGNLVMRGGGALIGLASILVLRPDSSALGLGEGELTVLAHVGFNAFLMVAGLVLASPLAHCLASLVTESSDTGRLTSEAQRHSALNEADLTIPAVALTNAQREMLMICERVEAMLARLPTLYQTPKAEALAELKGLDNEVDALHTAIKLYVSRIPENALDSQESIRAADVLAATIKLEQIADIITHNLVTKAEKKASRAVEFSEEGWSELSEMLNEVVATSRLAFSVLVTSDLTMVRTLAESKQRLRELGQYSEQQHLRRLRSGFARSQETSTLHLDMIRDLKEINSLLVSLTYPQLEREGMLRASRLVG